jgi:hypothetical protein
MSFHLVPFKRRGAIGFHAETIRSLGERVFVSTV